MSARKRIGITLYTSGQVAQLLGVSPGLVGKWIDNGLLEGFRLPHSKVRRVSHAALEEYAEAHGLREVAQALAATRPVQQPLRNPDREWLTTGRVAQLLGLSSRKVMTLYDAGYLEGHRLPGVGSAAGDRRFSRESVLRYARAYKIRDVVAALVPSVLLVGFPEPLARQLAALLPEGCRVDCASGVVRAALLWQRYRHGRVVLDGALGGERCRELAGVLAEEKAAPLVLAVRPEDQPPGWLGVAGVVELPADGLSAESLAGALARVNGG